MKKIIALILTLAALMLASCDHLPEHLTPAPEATEQTVTFTASLDYSTHVDGEAILLLDYCNVFFDLDDWGIGRINAGDVIEMRFYGVELLIQESYPGTVVTKDIEIRDITAQRADVIELTVKKIGDAVALSDESGKVSSLLMTTPGAKRYIVYEDGSYAELSEKHVGEKIYATGKLEGSSFRVAAYYAFNPAVSE